MKNIINILATARTLSGNEQLNFFKSHSDNLLLKEMLLYCLDTNKKYKITEKKYDKCINNFKCNETLEELHLKHWQTMKTHLTIFSSRKALSEEVINDMLNDVVKVIGCEQFELFKAIMFKDLRLSIGIKKLNTVWSDFCFKYPYCGAKAYSEKNLSKINMPCYTQIKADGLFMNLIIGDSLNESTDYVKYVSRQGKDIDIRGKFDFLKDHTYFKDSVLTGELLVMDENGIPLPRKTSNGIIKSDEKTPEDISRIVFVVWDIIPMERFLKGKYDTSYHQRLKTLTRNIDYLNGISDNAIKLVTGKTVNSVEEAMAYYESCYSAGEEGIIVKDYNFKWRDGKPSSCVKIKAEKECDLQMTCFIEGRGKYSGMCGSIRCMSSDGLLRVNIKPRTPLIAQEIWNNVDKYHGKIVAVKFNEVEKDKNEDSYYSLYLPVFVEIRDGDKAEADTLETIREL